MNATAPTATEVERRRVMLVLALRDFEIPKHMHDGVIEYVLRGRSTGAFLAAMIDDDLDQAALVADTLNKLALPRWAELFNSQAIPRACWGCSAIRAEWQHKGGIAGNADKTPALGTPAIADTYVPKRPSPSVMIVTSSDAARLVANAHRALMAELAQPTIGRVAVEEAANALHVAMRSLEALQAEAAKAIR